MPEWIPTVTTYSIIGAIFAAISFFFLLFMIWEKNLMQFAYMKKVWQAHWRLININACYIGGCGAEGWVNPPLVKEISPKKTKTMWSTKFWISQKILYITIGIWKPPRDQIFHPVMSARPNFYVCNSNIQLFLVWITTITFLVSYLHSQCDPFLEKVFSERAIGNMPHTPTHHNFR